MKTICADSVDIALPAPRVFEFVADLARWPLWLSFVVCAQQHGEPQPRPLGQDQEIDVCMQRGRRREREAFEVTQFVANAFVCLEGVLSASRRIDFRFEQRRHATRVHVRVGYPVFGGSFGRLRDALLTRGAVAAELRRSLRSLKSALEETDGTAQQQEREEALAGSAKQQAIA